VGYVSSQQDSFLTSNTFERLYCSGSSIYSYLIRPGKCWPYGDGYYFSGSSSDNSTYFTYNYPCNDTSNNVTCGGCATTQYNFACQSDNQLNNSINALKGVTTAVGDTVGAYFTGDSTCKLSSLTSIETIGKGYCYSGYPNDFLFNCNATSNKVYISSCTSGTNCGINNCNVTETWDAGACVNSSYGLGWTKYICGSYTPFAPITTTSTGAAATSTTGTSGITGNAIAIIVPVLLIILAILSL